jgi:hypothetical protein
MSKVWRRILLIVAILLVILFVILGVLYWKLKQVPEFYRQTMQASSQQLAEAQQQLQKRVDQLKQDVRFTPQWSISLTEQQVNGWLASQYGREQGAVTQPRVRIYPDHVEIACRAHYGSWQAVISASITARLTSMPNILELEIQSVQAGTLSIAWTGVLDRARSALQQTRLQTRWFSEEDPIRVELTVPARWGRAGRFLTIERLELADGQLTLHGSSE